MEAPPPSGVACCLQGALGAQRTELQVDGSFLGIQGCRFSRAEGPGGLEGGSSFCVALELVLTPLSQQKLCPACGRMSESGHPQFSARKGQSGPQRSMALHPSALPITTAAKPLLSISLTNPTSQPLPALSPVAAPSLPVLGDG